MIAEGEGEWQLVGMENLQQKIEEQIGAFVCNLNALIRQAATDALERAISVQLRSTQRDKRPKGINKAIGGESSKQPAAARDPAELSTLTERLYKAIASQPGETMQMLAPVVGCPPVELRVSIGHLLKRGRVKRAGERQQTRYFPMDAEPR